MNMAIQAPAPQTSAANVPARMKAETAACEFEGILLSSLLEKLQTTFAGIREDNPSGSGNYAVMGTQALASALAARGGIGVARMLVQQWQTKVPELDHTEVPLGR